MTRTTALAAIAIATLSSACSSGLRIQPPRLSGPPQGVVAAIQVEYGEELPADRVRMLDRFDVPALMEARIAEGLQMAGGMSPQGVQVSVVINSFRNPNYGPALLGTQVTVVDASGNVVQAFEANDTTMRSASKAGRIQVLVQSVVNQIAAGL